MVYVCVLLFVYSVTCSRNLYAIKTTPTLSFYDFSSYKSISLPSGEKGMKILRNEIAYGDINGRMLDYDTTYVAVVYGDDERFMTLSDENSFLPQFVGNLIVQVCDTNFLCFAEEIGAVRLRRYSIKIGGTGVFGPTYVKTSSYEVDMGFIKDDGRYKIFNLPAFFPLDATVYTAGKSINLPKATGEDTSVAKEESIEVMGYLSPEVKDSTGTCTFEVMIPNDFGDSSLVSFSMCGKTGVDKHCDKFHYVLRPQKPPHREIVELLQTFDADTYHEISAFKFENNLGSVKMRRIYFGVSVIKAALLEKYEELPCGNKEELRCSFIRCSPYNGNCRDFGEKSFLRVSVKGYNLNRLLIKTNGEKIGHFQCKNIGKRQSCTGHVTLPTKRKNEVKYGQCTVSLGRGKQKSYEMCGGGSKLVTIVMEWLE